MEADRAFDNIEKWLPSCADRYLSLLGKAGAVLFWGAIPAGCKGNICPVERYYIYDKHRRSSDDQV